MDSSTTRTDLVICKYISQAMEANGITQADLSKALEGRSKGYISDRVLGKRSWAIILLYLVVFRFGLPECLEIRKRWYFNAFAILQVVTGYDCMERNVTVFVCGLYAE